MIQYPVSVDGVSTRVLEEGQGPDAVVFVHGVGARADRWAGTVTEFARHGYRAVALDLPGHGFATKDDHFPYTVPGYARFLAGFLQELSIGRTCLVGTSMGGHVAARFACDHSDRATALVLVGSLGIVPLGPAGRQLISESIRNADREAIARKLRTLVFDPGLVDDAWIHEETMINNSPGAEAAFSSLAEYFRTRVDYDLVRDDVATLAAQIPTLLVWGTEDVFVPLAVGQAAQRSLPGARFETIEQAAHAPYLERPEAFHRIVLGFLADILDRADAAKAAGPSASAAAVKG